MIKHNEAEIVGPLAIRRFHAPNACQAHVGHEHNYDHDTFVLQGRIKVLYGDGTESREVGPLDGPILIKAGVRHTVKALVDDTHFICVYPHRDFDGQVVEHYVGNLEETGHLRTLAPSPSVRISLS